MVNMFNMGKFQNIRMAHNTYRPIQPHYGQPQQQIGLFSFGCGHSHHVHTPTNITINQGPQGFWGFMGGLFGGLFGGFGLGNIFGGNMFGGNMFGNYGMSNMYGMGGIPNYGSLFNNVNCLSLGNTAGTTSGIPQGTPQANQLKNLNELFKGYKIVAESDGTFTTISKDGKTIISGSYEDLKTKLSEDQIKYGKTEKKDDVDSNKKSTVADNTKETVDNKDNTAIDNNTKETVDNKEDTAVDNNTKETVDNNEDTAVDNNTKEAVDNKEDTAVDNNTKETIDNNEDSAVDNNKKETVNNEDKTTVNNNQETVVNKNNNEQNKPTKPEPVGANKVQAGTYQDTFTIHDDVQGKSADINAKSYTFGSINSQGYPSNIKVNGRTYNFVEVKNGTAIYETVKSNGAREQYRLEQNPDGKYALNQYEGDLGAGKSTSTTQNNSTTDSKPTTPTQQASQTISLAGKPVTINFFSDVTYEPLSGSNGSSGGYATATVNGKTYTVSVGPQDSHSKVMQKLGEAMMAELKAAGYKDIKLTNSNFNFQMSENGEVKNVQNNSNIDWNNTANKSKPMKLNIEFSIKVSAGNVGTASVKLPNGEEITAWVGPSLTSQRARASLADNIQDKLQKAGWTNVTLVNDNFNWESGPKQD